MSSASACRWGSESSAFANIAAKDQRRHGRLMHQPQRRGREPEALYSPTTGHVVVDAGERSASNDDDMGCTGQRWNQVHLNPWRDRRSQPRVEKVDPRPAGHGPAHHGHRESVDTQGLVRQPVRTEAGSPLDDTLVHLKCLGQPQPQAGSHPKQLGPTNSFCPSAEPEQLVVRPTADSRAPRSSGVSDRERIGRRCTRRAGMALSSRLGPRDS